MEFVWAMIASSNYLPTQSGCCCVVQQSSLFLNS